MYFYQPSQGHGLPHDPLNAIIGPRPIGWIASSDSNGRHNLAPYSFFNCFNYHPPIIGFASTLAFAQYIGSQKQDRRGVADQAKVEGSGN